MNRIKNELIIASCISTHSKPQFTTLLLDISIKYSTVEAVGKDYYPWSYKETFAEIPSVLQAPVHQSFAGRSPKEPFFGKLY